MKKTLFGIIIGFSVSLGAVAATKNYKLVRTTSSTDACLDFIFGMSGSTQYKVNTVNVVSVDAGTALGFLASEVGDMSDLSTSLPVIAPATYLVFNGDKRIAKFHTGSGYVAWNVTISDEINDEIVLTSSSREGFGLGKKITATCVLRRP